MGSLKVLLSQQGGDHPGQHIAGTSLCHAGIPGAVEPSVAVWSGSDSASPLEDQRAAVILGKSPGCRHPVLDGEGTPRQPDKFPGVRGQDRGRPPSVQTIYMPGQGIYAIGVQHHWYLQVT